MEEHRLIVNLSTHTLERAFCEVDLSQEKHESSPMSAHPANSRRMATDDSLGSSVQKCRAR